MAAVQDSGGGQLPDDPHQEAALSAGHDDLAGVEQPDSHRDAGLTDHQGDHHDAGSSSFLGAAEDLEHSGIVDGAPGVFGTPVRDSHHSRPQTTSFTCDLVAQLDIFEALTGHHIPEAHGATDAAAHGFLTNQGTLPEHMSKLLELYGIPCHENTDGTFLDVIKELRDGNKVIVGVHADGLWKSNDHLDAFASQAADHAIWVTGVDASDPNHVKVIINDSGTPDGAGNVYDLHELEDVLNCPGFHYVATGANPPDLPDHPEGYDETHHVFSGLDQFLHDHGVAVVAAGGLGVALSAALVMDQLNSRWSATNSGGEDWATPPAVAGSPALPARPTPLMLCDETSQTRDVRDRALRDL